MYSEIRLQVILEMMPVFFFMRRAGIIPYSTADIEKSGLYPKPVTTVPRRSAMKPHAAPYPGPSITPARITIAGARFNSKISFPIGI